MSDDWVLRFATAGGLLLVMSAVLPGMGAPGWLSVVYAAAGGLLSVAALVGGVLFTWEMLRELLASERARAADGARP
ncbi:MAG: hypothetical protein KJ792_01955 [Actinobacteria bacterium]|nr:hypothetical protein [Actinomycetota bacterium]MCG2801711.1 hypothetical protein [Cellulomonas sp.]